MNQVSLCYFFVSQIPERKKEACLFIYFPINMKGIERKFLKLLIIVAFRFCVLISKIIFIGIFDIKILVLRLK